jgi:hypothetical protein
MRRRSMRMGVVVALGVALGLSPGAAAGGATHGAALATKSGAPAKKHDGALKQLIEVCRRDNPSADEGALKECARTKVADAKQDCKDVRPKLSGKQRLRCIAEDLGLSGGKKG